MCQPRQEQGGCGQAGWRVGGQAGVQQGELAEEAAQVLGSWRHRDQRQQDVLVINHSGDLDGTRKQTWGLSMQRAHQPSQQGGWPSLESGPTAVQAGRQGVR